MPRKKTDKAPSMPFYGKDFYTDERVIRLSWAHQGLYARLLWWQWIEMSIAAGIKEIATVVGQSASTRTLWTKVEPFFPVMASDPTRRQNAKLESVRADRRAFTGRFDGTKEVPNRNIECTSDVPPKGNVAAPLAVAVPLHLQLPSKQETSFSSESRSRSGNTSGHDHNGRFALWSQRQFQYKADKISQWVESQKAGGTGPGEEDFESLFLETWSMSWEYWLTERDWHLEFFGTVAV